MFLLTIFVQQMDYPVDPFDASGMGGCDWKGVVESYSEHSLVRYYASNRDTSCVSYAVTRPRSTFNDMQSIKETLSSHDLCHPFYSGNGRCTHGFDPDVWSLKNIWGFAYPSNFIDYTGRGTQEDPYVLRYTSQMSTMVSQDKQSPSSQQSTYYVGSALFGYRTSAGYRYNEGVVFNADNGAFQKSYPSATNSQLDANIRWHHKDEATGTVLYGGTGSVVVCAPFSMTRHIWGEFGGVSHEGMMYALGPSPYTVVEEGNFRSLYPLRATPYTYRLVNSLLYGRPDDWKRKYYDFFDNSNGYHQWLSNLFYSQPHNNGNYSIAFHQLGNYNSRLGVRLRNWNDLINYFTSNGVTVYLPLGAQGNVYNSLTYSMLSDKAPSTNYVVVGRGQDKDIIKALMEDAPQINIDYSLVGFFYGELVGFLTGGGEGTYYVSYVQPVIVKNANYISRVVCWPTSGGQYTLSNYSADVSWDSAPPTLYGAEEHLPDTFNPPFRCVALVSLASFDADNSDECDDWDGQDAIIDDYDDIKCYGNIVYMFERGVQDRPVVPMPRYRVVNPDVYNTQHIQANWTWTDTEPTTCDGDYGLYVKGGDNEVTLYNCLVVPVDVVMDGHTTHLPAATQQNGNWVPSSVQLANPIYPIDVVVPTCDGDAHIPITQESNPVDVWPELGDWGCVAGQEGVEVHYAGTLRASGDVSSIPYRVFLYRCDQGDPQCESGELVASAEGNTAPNQPIEGVFPSLGEEANFLMKLVWVADPDNAISESNENNNMVTDLKWCRGCYFNPDEDTIETGRSAETRLWYTGEDTGLQLPPICRENGRGDHYINIVCTPQDGGVYRLYYTTDSGFSCAYTLTAVSDFDLEAYSITTTPCYCGSGGCSGVDVRYAVRVFNPPSNGVQFDVKVFWEPDISPIRPSPTKTPRTEIYSHTFESSDCSTIPSQGIICQDAFTFSHPSNGTLILVVDPQDNVRETDENNNQVDTDVSCEDLGCSIQPVSCIFPGGFRNITAAVHPDSSTFNGIWSVSSPFMIRDSSSISTTPWAYVEAPYVPGQVGTITFTSQTVRGVYCTQTISVCSECILYV